MILKDKLSLKRYLGHLGPSLADRINDAQDLTDVGCATGQLLNLLHEDFKKPKENLCGFDLSDDFVAEATKSFPRVYQMDFAKQSPAGMKSDVVFALDVLEHVEKPAEFMRNICSVMKNDGLLVLSTPNFNSLSRLVEGKNWFGFKDPTHRAFYDKNSLAGLLSKAGLRITEFKTISATGRAFYDKFISATSWGGQILILAEKRRLTVSIYNIGVGNTELLATKMRYWQNQDIKIRMVCPKDVVPSFKELIHGVGYLEIPFCRIVRSKIVLIFELLKRSLVAAFFAPRIVKDADVLYSISAVLDELLVPFFIRTLRKDLVWVSLFENEVVLNRPGNFLVRLLALVFYRISLILLRRADVIFVVSEDLRSVLIKQGFDQSRIFLTGNAIDRKEIEEAISEKQKECDALFLGRIDQGKGVFDLIEIARQVVRRHPDFSLWIAGSGDAQTGKELARRIGSSGLEKNVKLLGYVSGHRKFQLLANCQMFLFPSYHESFGVALLEAVCTGKKAIAYDLKAYRNIYLNDELIRIPPGDVENFSRRVIEILDKKDFENPAGLRLLRSDQYNYDRLAQLELDNFKKL